MKITKNGVLCITRENDNFRILIKAAYNVTQLYIPEKSAQLKLEQNHRKGTFVLKVLQVGKEVHHEEGSLLDLCSRSPEFNNLYWVLKNYCGAHVYAFNIAVPIDVSDTRLKSCTVRIHEGRGKNQGMRWLDLIV